MKMKCFFLTGCVLCFGLFSQLFAEIPLNIQQEIDKGNFSNAKELINTLLIDDTTPPDLAWDLRLQRELIERVEYDFSANENKVMDQIKRYYPDVTAEQLEAWKKEKSLETKIIDGKERYFLNAGPNLFRINKEALKRKREVDGVSTGALTKCLRTHLPQIAAESREKNSNTGLQPKDMVITYTLTVPANTVPEGEVLRCWLPWPREDHRRQTAVKLLDSNLDHPVFAPNEYEHHSVYSEKTTVQDQPTVFQIKFQMTTTGEWFDLENAQIQPYDTDSELYKYYTAERDTHVIFTDEIKALSEEFVGDEKDPVQILKKIFAGIVKNYPWASALEYSTMSNIPSYVIENNHGDCGMVGLLLITLCRYNGIPAKWQSGFMLHPGAVNLHDWTEVYFEGIGWVPVDPSFGRQDFSQNPEQTFFFMNGIDSYRWIVNEDYSMNLFPAKIYPRSETVDFQRGEVEWRGGNLFFNTWKWNLNVEYLEP